MDWSFPTDGQLISAGTTSTTVGVAVTVGNGSKGSWFELMAASSNSFPAQGFILTMCRTGAADWDCLYDVGIGGAGSETVVVSDFLNSQESTMSAAASINFPIAIPGGSRVAARAVTASGGVIDDVMLHLVTGGWTYPSGFAGATGLGGSTSTGKGTSVTPGSSVKGSYSQIIASTAQAYKGIMVRLGTNNAVIGSETLVVDVALGGAGSEVVIVPNLVFKAQNDISTASMIPVHIPAASRVAVRAAGSATNAFGCSILGFY
jgi:hypothetical protein